jgi:hypothetical protein
VHAIGHRSHQGDAGICIQQNNSFKDFALWSFWLTAFLHKLRVRGDFLQLGKPYLRIQHHTFFPRDQCELSILAILAILAIQAISLLLP